MYVKLPRLVCFCIDLLQSRTASPPQAILHTYYVRVPHPKGTHTPVWSKMTSAAPSCHSIMVDARPLLGTDAPIFAQRLPSFELTHVALYPSTRRLSLTFSRLCGLMTTRTPAKATRARPCAGNSSPSRHRTVSYPCLSLLLSEACPLSYNHAVALFRAHEQRQRRCC